VQLQAEIADPRAFQSPFNNLERGLLLGHEEYGFAGGQAIGYDVGDRLRFASAWRTLNDEIVPLHCIDDGAVLRNVCIMDQEGRRRLNRRVIDEVVGRIARDKRTITLEAFVHAL
jgi:hypothetical protein